MLIGLLYVFFKFNIHFQTPCDYVHSIDEKDLVWTKMKTTIPDKIFKIGWDKKRLISTFACFVTAIASCLHPNLTFF